MMVLVPGGARTDVARLDDRGLAFLAPIPAEVEGAAPPDLVQVGELWYRVAWLEESESTGGPILTAVHQLPENAPVAPVPPAGLAVPDGLEYVATLSTRHHVLRKKNKLAFLAPGEESALTIKRKKERKTDLEILHHAHPSTARAMVEIGDYGPLFEVLVEARAYRPLFSSDGIRARYLGDDRIVAIIGDSLVLYAHDPSAKVQLSRLDERPFLGGWFDVRRGRVLTVERARKQLLVHVLDGSGDRFVEQGAPLTQAGPSHMSRVTEVGGDVYVAMGRDTFALRW